MAESSVEKADLNIQSSRQLDELALELSNLINQFEVGEVNDEVELF